MKAGRDVDLKGQSRIYGLGCTLISGGVILAAHQFLFELQYFGQIIVSGISTYLPGQAEYLSHIVLYLLLFVLLILGLLRLNRYCFRNIIAIHEERTRLLDPASVARDMNIDLLQENTHS